MSTSHLICKKRLHKVLGKPVYQLLSKCSHHHSGIIEVAVNLTNYLGNELPLRSTTLLDSILSEALSIWESNVHSTGIDQAYQSFCQHVLTQLPYALDYFVSGIGTIHSNHTYTWDCYAQGYYEWIEAMKITPSTIEIVHAPAEHTLHRASRAFLLAHHVFNRSDFDHLGLASEHHYSLSKMEAWA
jgi:hypothetical protein